MAAAMVFLTEQAVRAANITFTAPNTCTGDTNALSMGGSVYAYDWGTSTTLNGVPFTSSTAIGSVGGGNITLTGFRNTLAATFVGTNAPYTNLSTAYQNVLKGAVYSNTVSPGYVATVALNNLQVSHVYALQVWVNDSRGGTFSNRLEWIYDGNGEATNLLSFNTTHTNGGVGQYTWGTFTADNTSQSFVLDNDAPGNPENNNILQMNALQLRDVTGVWSGTTSGAWADSDSTSANFTGLSYQAVKNTGATNVFFGDVDGSNNPVVTTSITVGTGGASGENVVFQNNLQAYTFNSADATGIAGANNVTLTGTNIVTFNGANTFTGNTSLSANSTLKLNNSSALADSASISLGAGALLDASSVSLALSSSQTLSGSGTVKGNVTAASGATIVPGIINGAGTLTFNNNLTLNGQAFSFDLGATANGASDKIIVGGTLTLNGNSTISLNLLAGTFFNGTYTLLSYPSKSGSGNFVLGQAYPGMTLNNSSTNVTLTVTGGLAGGGTSGVWIDPTGGNWTTPTNWQGSVIATNKDAVADFSTLTMPANETINVNSTNITIGYMVFGDVGQTYSWTLSGGTNTLAVSSGSPTIMVGTNVQADVNSVLAGSQGLSVEGPGILVLGGANTITNGVSVVNGGSLAVTSVKGLSSMLVSSNNPVVLSNGFFEFATSGALFFTNDLHLLGNANTTNTVYQGSSAQDSFIGRIYGSGVLNITTPNSVVIGQRGDMSGFTGTVLVTGSSSGANAGGFVMGHQDAVTGISGSSNAVFDFEGNTLNYLYNGTTPANNATNYMGALMGNNANVVLNSKNGTGNVTGNLTVEVGALNTSTTFAGKFKDYANANTASSPPQLAVRKVGTGNLTLSGANINTGPSEIRSGQLTVSGSYAASVTVDSGATFELSGSVSSPSVTVNSGGYFLLDNGGSLGSTAVQVNGLMDVSSWSGNFNLQSASLSGSGVVTGAVTLASTTINPGPVGGAGTLIITNGDFSVSGGTLAFDLSNDATNGVNDQLIVNGNLNLNGPATLSINKLNGNLNGGTYRLILFSGALNGSLANLTLQGTGPLDALQQNGNEIDLVISPVATVVWTGGTAGNFWDVTNSPNWTLNGVQTTFTNGEAALFNNTGATNPVVAVPATVQPVAVFVSSSSNYTFTGSADIGDGASLTKSGTGTLTVLNANTYVGGTYVTGGTLMLGDGVTQNGAVAGNIADNATLIMANPSAQTFSGVISGTGAMLKQGAGVLTLNATNSLTGPTTISAGVLELGDGSSADGLLGIGSVTDNSQLLLTEIATATIGNNITGNGGIDNNSTASVILSGNITGTCILTNDVSAASLYLTASNGYSGGTFINNGTVIVNDATLHGLGTGDVVINDGTGTLQFAANGSNVCANSIQLPFNSITEQFTLLNVALVSGSTVRLTGLISGGEAGQITHFVDSPAGSENNRGTLILDNPNNSFTTVPEVYLGTLEFTSDGAFGNVTNAISVNEASHVNTTFYSSTTGGLQFGSNNITLNANRNINLVSTENIDVQSYTGTIAGPITGSGLIKEGAGTLILNGPGSLTNSTTVSAGTLVINNAWTGTNVTVSSGATLSGAGNINAPVQISSGGALAPGVSSTALLTVTSNLLFNSGSTAHMNVNASTSTSDQVAGIGTVTYAGTLTVNNLGGAFTAGQAFQLFSAAGYGGAFAATNLPALAGGLAWKWNSANGTLSVVSGIATNPTNITATVSGENLNLSWPADHTGWRLLVQTNSLTGTNWVTWPNSTTTNSVSIPINSAVPSMFFRMVYP